MLPSIFGERLIDDFFDDPFDSRLLGSHNPLYDKHAKNLMKTDIQESDGGYKLAVDLPGFRKDEIQVDLADGYLAIRAEKALDKDKKDADGHYIRRERYSGSCARQFYVGDIKREDVCAKYENDILMLSLPKTPANLPPAQNHIAIE